MSEEPIKLEENWRNPDGTLKKGHPDLGAGRPKGQTLKEYQAQKFREMTEEQKEEFLKEIIKETRWKMAEGNPHQGIGQAEELDKLSINIINYGGKDNNNTPQLPAEGISVALPTESGEVQDSGLA
jgi:hypothetical protein